MLLATRDFDSFDSYEPLSTNVVIKTVNKISIINIIRRVVISLYERVMKSSIDSYSPNTFNIQIPVGLN